ncbi:glycoside hydrolase family 97 protein [Bythopirellula polymerisocia]|uniref:Retaining alpha-galactosidase n=1 Tax=Bythopirellula polymerisocia TaxID=2528003 RepID=A0A5C6CN39_9BACT|nr:glycoside hydrolase family 97 protein [Bythopirellula polymerisocia]TWU25495.1 Retaining alpha-galactosidase precursor [Bythopirellula polymerisocia]
MNNRSQLLATFLSLGSILACLSPGVAQEVRVQSPHGNLELVFNLREGVPTYTMQRQGKDIIGESQLGVALANGIDLDKDFEIASTSQTPHEETWIQPWGEQRQILNAYNELQINLRQQGAQAREMAIVFRLFEDGVGFRYEWPEQLNLPSLVIMDERTEFNLIDDCSAWWIPAYDKERYEYLYQNTSVSKIEKVHTPLTMSTPDGIYLSIHEAALVDYASMTLAREGDHKLKADLVPWSDGTKVKATLPHVSPWRTIQVADNAGDLITSYLNLNLNEPSKIKDTSWIKPGKYVGIWWELHLGRTTWGSGEHHGATTQNVKRYIDFAAQNGFNGVLVEGWNQGWDGDWITNGDQFSFTKPYPDFNIEELANYAKSKNVSLIGHHETGGAVLNYESQLQDAMDLYQKYGYAGVKTGYVNYGQNIKRIDENGVECREWHHGQFMVNHYQRVLEEAARHKLMLDVHEPIKETGLRRTYPNMMTREGARGQEYDAWSADGGNPPNHTTILPFTRLLAGPMDYTPGIFDLLYEEARPDNRVNGTLAKQLALYVVIYSPLQMVADVPENYEPYQDAFQFIVDVPTDWEETRVLNGAIGDFITIARKERGGQDWFLGAITDEADRTLEVPLAFLDRNRTYLATIYRDADDADWQTEPTKYTIDRVEVTSQTVLPLRLAAGGGQAISFQPQDAQRISQQRAAAVPKK